MKALELILIIVILVSFYTVLSSKNVVMKIELENDYWKLKHEALSLARIIADSDILYYYLRDGLTQDEIESIKVIVFSLAPPGLEIRLRIIDSNYNAILDVSTPNISKCMVAACGTAIYTHSLIGTFIIEVVLGREL